MNNKVFSELLGIEIKFMELISKVDNEELRKELNSTRLSLLHCILLNDESKDMPF